jgi:hypothetical protein
MDQKSTPSSSKPAPKSRTGRAKATTETLRLFIDAEELNRRIQNAPMSRYVE